MGRRRSWIRRLERRNTGGMVRIRLRDGSTRVFLSDDLWEQLFLLEAGAAVGEGTPTAASLALEGATPEAAVEVRALIVSEGGDFLRAATADGFGNTEPLVPDLSDGERGASKPA